MGMSGQGKGNKNNAGKSPRNAGKSPRTSTSPRAANTNISSNQTDGDCLTCCAGCCCSVCIGLYNNPFTWQGAKKIVGALFEGATLVGLSMGYKEGITKLVWCNTNDSQGSDAEPSCSNDVFYAVAVPLALLTVCGLKAWINDYSRRRAARLATQTNSTVITSTRTGGTGTRQHLLAGEQDELDLERGERRNSVNLDDRDLNSAEKSANNPPFYRPATPPPIFVPQVQALLTSHL